LTISGRDPGDAITVTNVLEGIGTVTFDGLSKVTFNLTANTNQQAGQALTWSGTYSMPTNCVGTINITTGDTATFVLQAYNTGTNYLITGQDGSYSLSGNGGKPPASACSAGTLNGTYELSASGVALSSTTLNGGANLAGLMVFNGTGGLTTNRVLLIGRSSSTDTTSGTYSVTAGCTGIATITDPSGNSYGLAFSISSTSAANFSMNASNSKLIFIGTGRIIP
jgi:hypothetical protein